MYKEDIISGILAIIIIIVFGIIIFSIVKCSPKVIKEEPINVRYFPAREEIQTEHEYKYNFLEGEWQLVPNTRTVTVPEKYEVEYLLTYDNGTTTKKWREVSKEVYEDIALKLNSGK